MTSVPRTAGPPRRLDSLEGLRFLSSVIVVAGHYTPYVVDTPLISRTHMAVDLFFVISGIVIAEVYAGRTGGTNYLRFVGRRIARLYPLHLATLGFYLAIGVAFWLGLTHPIDGTRYNPAAIVPNLLMIHAWLPGGVQSFNYVSWSISAEFLMYLLFPLLAWAVGRRPRAGLALVLATLALATLIAAHWLGRPLTRLSWDFGVLRALPSFAFGVWVSSAAPLLARQLPPRRLRWLAPMLLAATALLFVVAVDQTATLLLIWVTVAVAFLADRADVATPVSAPVLARRGVLTYSIYMLHTVVATIVMAAAMPRLIGTALPARIAALLVAITLLYLLSRASLRWFEQPLRDRINRWADGRLAVAPVPAAASR